MTYDDLRRTLSAIYPPGEATAVARMVLDEAFGLSLTDICCGKVEQLPDADTRRLEAMARRLADAEPVQYVLGHAWFAGRRYEVTPDVLIPRPETEGLCLWARQCVEEHEEPCGQPGEEKEGKNGPRLLDIGTGSGCIAITMALQCAGARVEACDISEAALAVARRNARRLRADARFHQADALHMPPPTQPYDVIVSNPPYICHSEASTMHDNVLRHEPHLALFVPDDNPLLFYRAITRYATQALRKGGRLLFEINPLYAGPMAQMMREEGLSDIETRNDCFGKKRFMGARL